MGHFAISASFLAILASIVMIYKVLRTNKLLID